MMAAEKPAVLLAAEVLVDRYANERVLGAGPENIVIPVNEMRALVAAVAAERRKRRAKEYHRKEAKV